MFMQEMLMAARCATGAAQPSASRVLQASRDALSSVEVTGGLLFDGECFMQLLQGPGDWVRHLTIQWLQWPLLQGARVLVEQSATTIAAGPWQAGFVDTEALDAILLLTSAAEQVAAFLQTLAQADVQ